MNGSNDEADESNGSPSTDSASSTDGTGGSDTDSTDTTDRTESGDGGPEVAVEAESGATSESDSDGPAETDFESVAEKTDLDMSAIDTTRKPDSRVRYQWILRSTVVSLVLGAILGGVAFLLAEEGALLSDRVRAAILVGGTVAALLFVFGIARAILLYRSWEYVVREDSLYLSRGVFTRVRTIVPYVRVQHIDTQRNPIERVLGLSTLVVYTAGSRGADVTIPGLTPERASELQTRLKVLAIESEEEAAV